jgi:peroxiredoxin
MKKIILFFVLLLSVAGVDAQSLKVAPSFTMNTLDGKSITLSEYVKGKKAVLIDFWASWCVPCRKEGKNVKAIYADYHDKGFDVLSVSMDNDAAKWKKAVEEEAYSWAQVSDLKAFKSPVCKQFSIMAVPCLYLVDANLNVIAVNLRGEALRNKIAEICK